MFKEMKTPVQEKDLSKESLGVSGYIEFRKAAGRIYRSVETYKDAYLFGQPAALSRKATNDLLNTERVDEGIRSYYYTDVPVPYDLTELSEDSLGKLIKVFGPDLVRAKVVSDNLAALDAKGIIPVGGSCVIETWGLQLLDASSTQAVKENPELQTGLAEALVRRSPYYTQVTGAMLQGGSSKFGVFYQEVFPWFLKVQGYGVSEAEEKTRLAYERITEAVKRRAKLVDPEYTVLPLQFSELDLESGGHLREWHEEYITSLPEGVLRYLDGTRNYNPSRYLASWVRYTYHGPEIANIVKEKVKGKFGLDLDAYNMHVRTKQLDHFRTPSNIFYPFSADLKKYEDVSALGIDYWQLNNRSPNNGFVGFDDLMVSGELVHQTPRLGDGIKKSPRTPEELALVFNSPTRLYAGNLAEHFEVLDKCVLSANSNFQEVREALKQKARIESMEKSISEETEKAEVFKKFGELLGEYPVAIISGVRKDDDNISKFTNLLRKKINQHLKNNGSAQKKLKEIGQKKYDSDKVVILEVVSEDNENCIYQIRFGEVLNDSDLRKIVQDGILSDVDKVNESANRMTERLTVEKDDYLNRIAKVGDAVIESANLVQEGPNTPVLPLYKNLIISHALQLSFDPDMREFIIDSVRIAESEMSESERVRLMGVAMAQILPKIKSYLTFIMVGGEYPADRFNRVYNPVFGG